MSRLKTGNIAIRDITTVDRACVRLSWPCEVVSTDTRKIHVPREMGAIFRPWITVQVQKENKGEMIYDHVMGLGMQEASLSEDDMDEVTRRVVGTLKQAIFQVQLEGLLQEHGMSWETTQRQDAAQVVVVRR